MRLEINQFGGMAPVVNPASLGDKFAEHARNIRFDRGVLTSGSFGLIESSEYPDVALYNTGAESVAKFFGDGTRFAFQNIDGEDAFPSPISPTDEHGRIYYLSPRGPEYVPSENYNRGQLTVNPTGYRLGVPAPAAVPTAVPDYTGYVVGNLDKVDVSYVYTFVDRYGQESPPSPATGYVTLAYDEVVPTTLGFSSPLPSRVRFNGGSLRIYRATFDGSSNEFQYLADISVTSTSWVDTIPVGQEGELLVSGSWYPAPEDLRQLCLVGSAFCAGFIDHHICYSESRLPHAWPLELQYPIKYNAVKLMPTRNGLVITTKGRPYWAEGSDPYSAIPQEIPVNAPCLSAGSVVDMGDYVMYASMEGLVAVTAGAAQVVTETFLSRADVISLIDDTCHAFRYNNQYVFRTRDNRWMAFSPEDGLCEFLFPMPAGDLRGVSYNVRDNRAYFTFSHGIVRMVDYTFSMNDAEWRSKWWRTPPVSFSCIRVLADIYPVTVEVRSRYLGQDWETTSAFQVTNEQIARLPPNVGTLWQVVVRPPSAGSVYSVVVAQSGREAQ